MINVVVLEGELARPAEQRILPSGSQLVSMELTVRKEGAPTETVPLSWPDAPAWASGLDTAAGVVVVGRVRRRFFKAGGSTQSRTEVVVTSLVPAGSIRKARTVLVGASQAIEAAAADLGDRPARTKRAEKS